MKKILIINGHPRENSFCHAISRSYLNGASGKGNEVVLLNLFDIKFDSNFLGTYSSEARENMEPDLVFAQQNIKWAQHIVIVHPIWWGSVPAALKGFLDKVLVPGFAFRYKAQGPWWDKLLAGRTGEIIYTSDTPPWFNRLFYGAPAVNMLRDRVFGFCGIKTTGVNGIGPIRNSTPEWRKNWLEKVERIGMKA